MKVDPMRVDTTCMTNNSAVDPRSFPGGKVRLPLLDSPIPDGPSFSIVGTAFVRDTTSDSADEPSSGFTGYFTYESLFNPPAEPEHTEALSEPYRILDVTPDTPWEDVAARHRALVKESHPDLFVGAPAEIQADAEEQIRLVNVAFTELRRIHPDGS